MDVIKRKRKKQGTAGKVKGGNKNKLPSIKSHLRL